MKVIFVNPQGNFDSKDSKLSSHPDFGGQLVYVKEVAIAMNELGVDVDIVTRRIEDPNWPEFSSKFDAYPNSNVRIVRLDFGPKLFLPKEKLWPYLGEFSKNMAEFYEKEKINFITTHYGDGGISGAMLAKYLKVPFSFTAHSLGAQKMDKLGVNAQNFGELDEIYNFSARILAEGISMKYSSFNVVSTKMERFDQYGHKLYNKFVSVDDDKFKVIPPGVNTRIFKTEKDGNEQTVREKLEKIVKKGKPLLILSSRLDPKKNHISVLKAYASSKMLRDKFDLLIVTNGFENVYENAEKYDQVVIKEILDFVFQNHLKDKVHFLDIRNQRDLAALYRVASESRSVFESVALYEPFGLAIIEAMACGLPVVATKNGGPVDIIRERFMEGLIVDPQNIEDIRVKTEKLIDPDFYDHVRTNGIKRVLSTYTWKSTAKRYLENIDKNQFEYEDFDIPNCFYSGSDFPKLSIY
jgi:sucrose-phosphate synthase